MLFNTITFGIFFLVVYPTYCILSHRAQNWFLLVASYVFYGWWNWHFLGLIALSTLIDYGCARAIGGSESPRARKLFLLISVVSNLGILGFFKYFNFFADSLVRLFHVLGFDPDPVTLNIVLPVGISFYTFQTMSYTIDVYRGVMKPTKSFLDCAVYVSFFPQLVAGPIERAAHLLPQVSARRVISYDMVREGAWLCLLGYFKKVVIADNLSEIANSVFNQPGGHTGLAVLIGIYAFAFQIYGDFSGYSDIARGISKLMGFDIMFNFRMPYFSQNPQEFWRRWHISLSTWLRDYLYISLGGNKKGPLSTYRNLFLTMLLGGLWHGAAWNFVFWGAYQGALLIVHRRVAGRTTDNPDTPRFVRLAKIAIMFQFVCFGWVLFRINHLRDLPTLMRQLIHPGGVDVSWLAMMALVLTPLLLLQIQKERSGDMLVVKRWPAPVRALVYMVLLAYIAAFGKVNGGEFIYFQF